MSLPLPALAMQTITTEGLRAALFRSHDLHFGWCKISEQDNRFL